MRKSVGLVLFISTFLCAAASLSALAFTYLRPQTPVRHLLNCFTIVRYYAIGITVCSIFAALIRATVPYVYRQFSKWGIGVVIARLPWYLRVCQAIAVLSLFVFIISDSGRLHLEAGKWMTGGSHTQDVLLGSEEAIGLAWEGLRRYAALSLGLSLMWMLYAYNVLNYELIQANQSTRGAYEK
jgi:hypothetical protein